VKKLLASFVLWYLRFFARIALHRNKPAIIGIAGSVGKSSLKNALFVIFVKFARTKALSGNSETGIPLSILDLDPHDYSYFSWLKNILKAPFQTNSLRKAQYLIAEMGIDDPHPPKNMEYLLNILKPDIAINLNVSATHSQQFEKALPRNKKKTVENLIDLIALEDTKIITKSQPEIGIYNAENNYIKKYIEEFRKKNTYTTLLSFGSGKNNSIWLKEYEVDLKKTRFVFHINEKKAREFTLTLRGYILPKAYADTFAAAILAARSVKIPLKVIQDALEEDFNLPPGRANIFEGIRNSIIIDSTYNSSKESVMTFLELLKDLKKKTKRPAVFVFGDMRELGAAAQDEHREVAERALAVANQIYCVGTLTEKYAMPILKNSNKRVYRDASKNSVQLGLHLKETLPENAIILLKGSQNEIFLEEAVKFILKNPNDEKMLCRQSEFWKNTKATYFNLS